MQCHLVLALIFFHIFFLTEDHICILRLYVVPCSFGCLGLEYIRVDLNLEKIRPIIVLFAHGIFQNIG